MPGCRKLAIWQLRKIPAEKTASDLLKCLVATLIAKWQLRVEIKGAWCFCTQKYPLARAKGYYLRRVAGYWSSGRVARRYLSVSRARSPYPPRVSWTTVPSRQAASSRGLTFRWCSRTASQISERVCQACGASPRNVVIATRITSVDCASLCSAALRALRITPCRLVSSLTSSLGKHLLT